MSQVLKLRSERAELNKQLQALAAKEAGGQSLSAEELSTFAALEKQIAEKTDQLARAESAERANAAAAVPVAESAQGVNGPPASPHITVTSNQPPGAGMAQMARLLVQAQGNQHYAAQLAQSGGFGSDVVMALGTITPAAGGVLVPTNMASEVIEALRPRSVVRASGAVSLPLNNGNMTLPRIKGSTVAGYIGSDEDIPVTDMQFADMKLISKKLAALVPISNDLIAFSGVNPGVDQIVANDLLTTVGLTEDIVFIRSAGDASTPKGMRYLALPANVVTAPAGAPNLAMLDLFFGGMMLRLEAANATMANCGWLMHPRLIRWLQTLRDGNGNKAYPEIDGGTFKGYPYKLSTQIPVNLGAGSNETECYFADFSDCYIGETGQLALAYSTEASYKDAGGNTVSAFQRDQTLIRVIEHNDFGLRHAESVAVGIGITWGEGM